MIMCKLFNFYKQNLNVNKFICWFVLFQFVFILSVNAEYLSSEIFNYTIDLQDGFYVKESNSTGYFLESDFIPIEIINYIRTIKLNLIFSGYNILCIESLKSSNPVSIITTDKINDVRYSILPCP